MTWAWWGASLPGAIGLEGRKTGYCVFPVC